jgi:uncharacterized membrane protein
MTKNRLEAFSDGVIAIILTIMVLEMKVPHGDSWNDLLNLTPVFLSYILSFIYVGIYWNNHHMLHSVEKVNGSILWANLHLLFWLSLLPFSTGWVGENHFSQNPVIVYGLNLLFCAIAYFILSKFLIKAHGPNSHFVKSLGSDLKGKISLLFYLIGILSAFYNQWLGMAIFTIVAVIWFIPDRRFEK